MQSVVADTDEVGAGLAAAVAVPEPRDELRGDVLAAAFAARPAVPQIIADLPPADQAPSGFLDAAPKHAAHGIDRHEIGDELAHRRARRSLAARTGWLVAAAAAVVAVVMSVSTFAALHSRDAQQASASRNAAIISAITGDGPARTVPLRADGGATVATVVAHTDSVTVVPEGMAVNSKSTTYVLWGRASATSSPVALGVFDVTGSKATAAQVGTDSRGYSSFTTFAVSQEPGRTPPAAPSHVVASGQA